MFQRTYMTGFARSCTALFLLIAARVASAATVTGRFDLDALPDTLTYDTPDEEGSVSLRIRLATPDGKGRELDRTYSASEGHISFRGRNPGEIVVFEKGDVAGATAYHLVYRYNPRVQDWLLVERMESDGVSSADGWEPPRIRITYADGVERLGGGKIDRTQAETESAADRRTRLAGELSALHAQLTALYKAHKLSTLPPSTVEATRLAELLEDVRVTTDTVEAYNNIGFFLVLAGNGVARSSSLYLLDQVVKAQPDRTPAYLNLADGMFDLGNTARAKAAYARYLELMKRDGKASKIPQRALDRAR